MTPAQVVEQLFDAFARSDLERALELVSDDVELWPQGTAERVGRTEPYRGHDGIREYFADVACGWESLAIDPGELRTTVGGVVCFGTARGRSLDGHEMVVPVIWVFKLRGGVVTSGRVTNTAPA